MKVRCIPHCWITMADGARLGARLWLPETSEPVPAILEYIPYRKDDYSAVRDSTTIAWFAGQGYACIRVDMRGSGSSDGVLYDEYSDQEIGDGVDVINWIANQDWCDGKVGTIGISWGGITGLQLAQRAPEALKTTIVLGASDRRYYDDGSYYMGCMVGQTIGWAAIMFGYNTRPPDPELVGDSWRELWFDRLEKAPHYMERWFEHQHEDEYWLNNTVAVDYDAINIPVYAVSGHADCWPNTVPRLLQKLSVPVRGLQGAWSHRYPHLAIPGPGVDFLADAARWFDQWLKGKETGILDEAAYQVYLQDSVRPQPYYESRPGRWIGEAGWPSDQVDNRSFFLTHEGLASAPQSNQQFEICSPQSVGFASGEYMPWFAFGPSDELPADQQGEDIGSLLFDTSTLDHDLAILGNAELSVKLSSDSAQALIAVRLCDVWPDGASTLITRGLLNLSQRNDKTSPEALLPGQDYQVTVVLNHVGYQVPAGHKLRLAISTSYWPMAWPSPTTTSLCLYSDASLLRLPLISDSAVDAKLTKFGNSQTPEPIATTCLREVDLSRTQYREQETGMNILEIHADNGKTRFEQSQMEMGSSSLHRFSIDDSNPLSAKAEYEWTWEYSRADWSIVTKTITIITCDQDYFYLNAESIAWEADTEVFRKLWDQKYIRDHF